MDKKSKKEEKELKKEIKRTKKLNKEKMPKPERAFKDQEAAYRSQRTKLIVELTIIIVFSILIILLLCNRTFFKKEYKTSKISLNIPLLMYFEKDNGEEIVMTTLRKSQYVKDFFDSELNELDRYTCLNNSFYYIKDTNTAIYKIDVKKDFIVKTVTIKYAQGDVNCLCETELTGKEATALCNK